LFDCVDSFSAVWAWQTGQVISGIRGWLRTLPSPLLWVIAGVPTTVWFFVSGVTILEDPAPLAAQRAVFGGLFWIAFMLLGMEVVPRTVRWLRRRRARTVPSGSSPPRTDEPDRQ
jgi:hypothetical protein